MRFIDTNGRLIDVFICLPSQVPNVLAKLAKARIQVKKVGDEYQVKDKVRLLNLICMIGRAGRFTKILVISQMKAMCGSPFLLWSGINGPSI